MPSGLSSPQQNTTSYHRGAMNTLLALNARPAEIKNFKNAELNKNIVPTDHRTLSMCLLKTENTQTAMAETSAFTMSNQGEYYPAATLRLIGDYPRKAMLVGGHVVLNPDGIDVRYRPDTAKEIYCQSLDHPLVAIEGDKTQYSYVISLKYINNVTHQIYMDKETLEVCNIPSDLHLTLETTSQDLPEPPSNVTQVLTQKWETMVDLHHIEPMLNSLGLTKLQAIRLLPSKYVQPIPTSALKTVLTQANEADHPLKIFVTNESYIELYTGTVDKPQLVDDRHLTLTGEKRMRFDIDLAAIDSAWKVTKPATMYGSLTSLEFFDREGNMLCLLYGKRLDDAHQEDPVWREWLSQLAQNRRCSIL